jgi:flagellar biosynthesis protein FlhB
LANSDPSKTEEATPKRRSEERDKGKVSVSQDITSVVTLLCTVILIGVLTPKFRKAFLKVFYYCFSLEVSDWTVDDLYYGIFEGLRLFSSSFLLILVAIFFVSAITIRCQTGSFFNLKPLEWKYDFLNLGSGIKQLLPDKTKIVTFLLTMSKVSIIFLICYFMIKAEMQTLLSTAQAPVVAGSVVMLKIVFKVTIYTLLIFVILAIIDLIWKIKKNSDDLMMTKEEVKDERRNSEGDPKVKAKIRRKMQELLLNSMSSNVQKSSVVITNPTHVAIAIEYTPGEHAPKVLAKGLRKRAQRIKEIARKANVPIIEAPPLARSLYRSTETGSYIDQQFFSAVAVILAKILKKKRGAKA